MIAGLVVLLATVYFAIWWNGERWLMWMIIGLAAVVAQVASYLADYLGRFRIGRSFPVAELRSKWVEQCETQWSKNLARTPIVMVALGLVGWWGHSSPGLGVPVQIALALLAWAGVAMGWITGIRLRYLLKRRR